MKRFLLLLLILMLFLSACSNSNTAVQSDSPFPPPGSLGTAARVYPVETGWLDGKTVRYYNMGTNTPLDPGDPSHVLISGVWVFAIDVNTDGSPVMLDGQDNILDSAPGDAIYSDLWRVFFVAPTVGYVPNSITSLEALNASGMLVEQRPMLVNCPFVPEGSSLRNDERPLKKGWVKDKQYFYFDFGQTNAEPGKLYVFVTGFNADGSPQLVAGQHFIFDSDRTTKGYSDFRQVYWVQVDGSYQADSIKSAKDIDPAKITASTIVVNYPQK